MARQKGARVVVSEINPFRINMLRGLGLDADSTCGSAFLSQVEREVTTYTKLARDLDLKAE